MWVFPHSTFHGILLHSPPFGTSTFRGGALTKPEPTSLCTPPWSSPKPYSHIFPSVDHGVKKAKLEKPHISMVLAMHLSPNQSLSRDLPGEVPWDGNSQALHVLHVHVFHGERIGCFFFLSDSQNNVRFPKRSLRLVTDINPVASYIGGELSQGVCRCVLMRVRRMEG